MTTTIESQVAPAPVIAPAMDPELVRQLRNDTCAVRVHIKRFGIRKALDAGQTSQAAGVFEAEKDVLRATKKLIETKGEAYTAVIRVLYQAKMYWRLTSIPYTEPGWRLIRRNRVEDFRNHMVAFVAELDQARQGLADAYAELKENAKVKLGSLYNDADYPATIDDQFSLEWDFPSVDPPDYLKQLHPEVYEEQLKKVAARFEQSLGAAEQMLTEELQKLVEHLADKLKPGEDGKTKQIRTTAVDNLANFFKRFEALNITSNGSLNEVVKQAQELVAGTSVEKLKSSADSRAQIAAKMDELKTQLDAMVIASPRRAISFDDDE